MHIFKNCAGSIQASAIFDQHVAQFNIANFELGHLSNCPVSVPDFDRENAAA
jgi:hypothetical protein